MAILDNAIWINGATGYADSGSTTISEGGASTDVTATFSANAFDETAGGTGVSQFGAYGVSSPITADYQFSTAVTDLTFNLEHVNSGPSNDDLWTIYAYDQNGDLLDSADVIAGISGLDQDLVYVNPDGSVSIEADGTNANDVTISLPGQISQLTLVYEDGPDAAISGGSGIGDLSFSIPDHIVEGTALGETIDASYTGDPEGDLIDAGDNAALNDDDVVMAGGGGDTVYAGSGNDTAFGGDGDDTVFGQDGSDTLYGGAGDDHLDGDDAFATGGADSIDGGTGNDEIIGDVGNDTLAGGADNDTIYAGDDDDVLIGGTGNDTLYGGAGYDTFVLDRFGGDDRIADLDLNDDDSDGFYNDQLDVSTLLTLSGTPVTAFDVTVVDDGFGNAMLVFPEGETLVLQGVTVAQMDSASELFAAGIPCFVAGTMIRTLSGERRVEDLRPGDLVETRNNGPQPVRWVGERVMDAGALWSEPEYLPIRINPGAFSVGRGVTVSPQHCVLANIDGADVLVRARHLVDRPGFPARICSGIREVSYHHIAFDRHEIIYSNGHATESFYPGARGALGSSAQSMAALFTAFPGLRLDDVLGSYGPTCARIARRSEVTTATTIAAPACGLSAVDLSA